MKRIRSYENYRVKSKREQIIKEAVLQVNDLYKVKTMVDIPQSLINKYVAKVKKDTGNDLRQFFGDVDIAEEIVKYINLNNLDIDKLPAGALMGGGQGQPQSQGDMQMQAQPQMQEEPQVQVQTQGEGQGQVQGQVQMEEPQAQVQPQGQGQFEEPQAQVQTQGQGQVQAQGQGQVQAQGQGEEEGEEELPL